MTSMNEKIQIMIVEDNQVNLKLAGDLLEIEGFEVFRCSDAEIALETLRTVKPALILMDVALPGMDGLELTRILKSDHKTSSIPIVSLTAFAMKGDKERVMEAGSDGYITKPIDTRKFKDEIMKYL
jgi:CheY-like chemotaxis protein